MIKGLENNANSSNGIPNHSDLSCLSLNIDCVLPSKCLHGIFNAENLSNNYKKLDQFY